MQIQDVSPKYFLRIKVIDSDAKVKEGQDSVYFF